MDSNFHFSKFFNFFFNVPMNYSIVRAADIGSNAAVMFVVNDKNNTAIKLDMRKNKFLLTPCGKKSFLSVRLLERTRKLAGTSADHHLHFWHAFSLKRQKRFGHADIVTNFLANAAHSRGASICHKGSFLLVDLDRLRQLRFVKSLSMSLWISNTFAFNFEQSCFFGNLPSKKHFYVYNLRKNRALAFFRHSGHSGINENFIYEQKSRVYAAVWKSALTLLHSESLKTKRVFKDFEGFSGGAYSFGSCRNGRLFMVGSSSGSLFVYSYPQNAMVVRVKQASSVFYFGQCSNPRFLVSCGEKTSPLRVWDARRTLDELAERKGVQNI